MGPRPRCYPGFASGHTILMNHRRARHWALVLSLALAAQASGVIIDSGNGTGNVTAPASDPGWANVGTVNGLTVVYLGDGWALTANHVGAGDTWFEGVLYPWVPGVAVRLRNPDQSFADLLLYRIAAPLPPLPALAIPNAAPPLGTSVVMIGNGLNRGAATTWDPPGPGPTYDGYEWGAGTAKRWGTNFVEDVNAELYEGPSGFATQLFGGRFHESGIGHSTHEAQAAVGDSGGAVFAANGPGYDLAGILIGILNYGGQPAQTALYGNVTVAADLSVYREEIVEWMPEPAGAGYVGAALVAALAGARRRITAPSSPGSRRTSGRAR